MREFAASLTQWAREVGTWWWAVVVGVFLGGEGLALFIVQLHRFIPWVITAALAVALTGSLLAYHRLRIAALTATAARHTPPGGGTPHQPPLDYQVTALRQVIPKISETMTDVTFLSLQAILLNHPRAGTDPIYEPLHPISCQAGLARLTELGELQQLDNWHWKIIAPAQPHPARRGTHARTR